MAPHPRHRDHGRDLTTEDRARLDSGIETVLMKESFSPASLIERSAKW